jgi:DNA invertase Pin-like site-specific DNA recombinase
MGWQVVKEYVETVSGAKQDREEFCNMLADADRRLFDVIVVWSLDRFSREGMSNMLGYVERLKKAKVQLRSLQETWLDISDDGIGQVLLAFMAWVAAQERKRISERTKAAYDRIKKKNGDSTVKWGRPVGSKDKEDRIVSGYRNRWKKARKEK